MKRAILSSGDTSSKFGNFVNCVYLEGSNLEDEWRWGVFTNSKSESAFNFVGVGNLSKEWEDLGISIPGDVAVGCVLFDVGEDGAIAEAAANKVGCGLGIGVVLVAFVVIVTVGVCNSVFGWEEWWLDDFAWVLSFTVSVDEVAEWLLLPWSLFDLDSVLVEEELDDEDVDGVDDEEPFWEWCLAVEVELEVDLLAVCLDSFEVEDFLDPDEEFAVDPVEVVDDFSFFSLSFFLLLLLLLLPLLLEEEEPEVFFINFCLKPRIILAGGGILIYN